MFPAFEDFTASSRTCSRSAHVLARIPLKVKGIKNLLPLVTKSPCSLLSEHHGPGRGGELRSEARGATRRRNPRRPPPGPRPAGMRRRGGGGVEDAILHHQHKLCGFGRVVVSVGSWSPSRRHQQLEEVAGVVSPRFPAPGVSCALSGEGSAVGFVSEDGFLLTPIQDGSPGPSEYPQGPATAPALQENARALSPRKQRGRSVGVGGGSPSTPSSRKRLRKGSGRSVSSCSPAAGSAPRRRKGLGFLNGSISVVHQLHALTSHKCLSVECRVVRVAVRGDGCARAVVLVDVYLPMAVWSGWQFPRSGALAASLFRHLRYYRAIYLSPTCSA